MTIIEKLTAERDHWERRYERWSALQEANPMRYDHANERIDYADGVRYGLDLAILALRHERNEAALTKLFGPPGSRTRIDVPDEDEQPKRLPQYPGAWGGEWPERP